MNIDYPQKTELKETYGLRERETKTPQENPTYKLVSRVIDGKYYHQIEGRRCGDDEKVSYYFRQNESAFKRDENLTRIEIEIKCNLEEKFTSICDD